MPPAKRFTWHICVPTPRHGKCATNPYKSSHPSLARPGSRQREGMAMCCNNPAVTAASPLTMPTVVASDSVRSARTSCYFESVRQLLQQQRFLLTPQLKARASVCASQLNPGTLESGVSGNYNVIRIALWRYADP